MGHMHLTRRTMLRGSAAGLVSLASAPALVRPALAQQNFDWKKHAGTELDVILIKTPRNDLVVNYLKEFKALTGIDASVELIPEQQYRQKLVIEFSSNRPTFDVAELTLTVQKRLAGKGRWFDDLKPMIADPSLTSPDFDFADFSKGAVESATQVDGRMDSLPVALDYFFLYYNKALFEAKGVQPPKTMDDMAEVARILHDPSKGVAGFVARGLKNANVPVWTSLLFGEGIDPITPDMKLMTTTPEAVRSGKLYQTLLGKYGPTGVAGFNWNECQTTFAQGYAAMWLDSTAWAKSLEDPKTSKIVGKVGYMTIPPGTKSEASGTFASGIGIASASRKKAASWLFLQWAYNKQNQIRLLQTGAGSPARSSAFASAENISNTSLPKAYFDVLQQCTKIGRSSLPNIIPVTEFRDIFGVALSNMINGADVESELATATEAFRPILVQSEK